MVQLWRNQIKFGDGIALRYGKEQLTIPSTVACGEVMPVSQF